MQFVTVGLVAAGGLVTTKRAGMAVPDWPSTYGYNLFLYPWRTWLYGPRDLFVEHGHRLLGALVGLLTLGFWAVTAVTEQRRWMRWLAVLAVVSVVMQGGIGGARVVLDRERIALVHGCVGPAFLAFCGLLTLFTSRRWIEAETVPHVDAERLHRYCGVTAVIVYLQIVAGAHVRHIPVDASPSYFTGVFVIHAGLAIALAVFLMALAYFARQSFRESSLNRSCQILVAAVMGQVGLGVMSWVLKYGWPTMLPQFGWSARFVIPAGSGLQSFIITAHVVLGAIILNMAARLFARSLREAAVEPTSVRVPPASWRATS